MQFSLLPPCPPHAPRLRRARRHSERESLCSLYIGLLRLGRRSPSRPSPAASPLPLLKSSASAARAAALSSSASCASAVGCSSSGDSRSYVCRRLLKPLVPASSEARGEMRSPCCGKTGMREAKQVTDSREAAGEQRAAARRRSGAGNSCARQAACSRPDQCGPAEMDDQQRASRPEHPALSSPGRGCAPPAAPAARWACGCPRCCSCSWPTLLCSARWLLGSGRK